MAIGTVGYQKKAAGIECPGVAVCSTSNNGHDTVNIVLWSEWPTVCDVNNSLLQRTMTRKSTQTITIYRQSEIIISKTSAHALI